MAKNPESEYAPTRHEAFRAPFAAIPFLLVRPKLLVLATAPLVINSLLLVLLAGGLIKFGVVPLAEKLAPGTGAFAEAVQLLVTLFIAIPVVLMSGLIAFLLLSPISAPFNDLISERVEGELLRRHPELLVKGIPWTHNMKHAVVDTLQRLFISLPLFVITVGIGAVPLCGPPIAAVITFLNAMFFLAVDAYAYSLDRRGVRLRGKFGYLNRRRETWFGLGTGMAIMLLIPCNIIFLPILGAVGATRLYCEEQIRRAEAGKG